MCFLSQTAHKHNNKSSNCERIIIAQQIRIWACRGKCTLDTANLTTNQLRSPTIYMYTNNNLNTFTQTTQTQTSKLWKHSQLASAANQQQHLENWFFVRRKYTQSFPCCLFVFHIVSSRCENSRDVIQSQLNCWTATALNSTIPRNVLNRNHNLTTYSHTHIHTLRLFTMRHKTTLSHSFLQFIKKISVDIRFWITQIENGVRKCVCVCIVLLLEFDCIQTQHQKQSPTVVSTHSVTHQHTHIFVCFITLWNRH